MLHNAIRILLLICSKSPPDDDPKGSKHLAIRMLYKVLFYDYLFIPYFIVQHSGMQNFQIEYILFRRYDD